MKWILTLLVLAVSAAAEEPADQQRFYGHWTLDTAASKMKHAAGVDAIQWRSFEPDGDSVKSSWGNGATVHGSYSAKCDGSPEATPSGTMRCWQVDSNTIDGEAFDKNDTAHRFYRRSVSADGATMTITWYSDAKHKHATDRFVYIKAPAQ